MDTGAADKHDDSHEESSKEIKRPLRSEHNMKNAMYLKREIHFNVESPIGEQMPVRYKPDATVDTLYQQACKKFNLIADEYYMVFNNRELDLGEVMRTLNINQNSVMKIYKGRKASTVPDIFVSVRVRDCRIGSVFRQTDNLWDILFKLLSETSYESDLVPIVIYMKQEFIGEDLLKQVRLRDMGITQGECIIRFLQLKQEDLDQRKMKEDEDALTTLESLELKASGPSADTGIRSVHFKLNEDEELDPENVHFIGERKTLAFRLPEPESLEEMIQEDYFDLKLDEIKVLFTEVNKKLLSSQMHGNVEELVRSELHKLTEIRSGFDETLVRLQFPDRTCLQSIFLPEETISDMKTYIRQFLKTQDEDFDLYLRNPQKVVEDSESFGQLGLVPIARLFYDPKDRRYTSIDQYLNDEVILNFVSHPLVNDAALMLRGESLDRFLMSVDAEREDGSRKSTGGFFSRFIRGSQSSRTQSGTKPFETTRSSGKHYSRMQSTFQPKLMSRPSLIGHARGASRDDDDDDDNLQHGSSKLFQARRKTDLPQSFGQRPSRSDENNY